MVIFVIIILQFIFCAIYISYNLTCMVHKIFLNVRIALIHFWYRNVIIVSILQRRDSAMNRNSKHINLIESGTQKFIVLCLVTR